MSFDHDTIDAQLRGALAALPALDIRRDTLGALRERIARIAPAPAQAQGFAGTHAVDTAGGPVQVHVYRHSPRPGQPALLWLHGGGYVLGNAADARAPLIARLCDCTVVVPAYRLAPEHPFPAALDDAHGVLQWMAGAEAALDIDPRRIAVGGVSAGGGLAAGLALLNRDRGGPPLCFQLLLYPMLDNLHDTPSGRCPDHPVWNRQTSLNAWEMYLGGVPGAAASPYAAAARASDVAGLPPTYLGVGSADLFRDENIDYVRRLAAAGVPCELAVFPGVYHGADMQVPEAAVSRRMQHSFIRALGDALEARHGL